MKAASVAMKNFLAGNFAFVRAELYTITLASGTVLRYTTGDRDIIFGGQTFLASGPFVERSNFTWTTGLEVDRAALKVAAAAAHLVDSVPFLQALRKGQFDNALIVVERLYMATYGDVSNGSVEVFRGNISDVPSIGALGAQISIKSRLELLAQPLPRAVFQPGCRWTLFDAGCKLVKASFAVANSVASGSTARVIKCTLAQTGTYFDQGTLEFTSGVCLGLRGTIKKYTSGSPALVEMHVPFFSTPGVGDTFNAYPGCDKLQATCSAKFSNLINFGGQPYVPVPETAF